MTRRRARFVGVAMAMLAWSSCTGAPHSRPAVRRWPLVTLPESYRKKSIFVSDDGTDAVYSIAEPGGDRVVHDGRPGPLLREIAPPRMAPGTHAVFYWALDLLDGRRTIFLYARGERVVTGFGRTGHLLFSPDGAHWAALGGIEIDKGNAQYERGPVVLFIDGARAGTFSDASLPAISPDSEHLALLVAQADGGAILQVDGRLQRRYAPPPANATPPLRGEIGPDMPAQYAVRYLLDGSLLTVATDADGWAVFHDDRRLGSYLVNVVDSHQGPPALQLGDVFQNASGFVPSTLTSAAGAPVAAWWVREAGAAGRWRVVRNGAPEPVACARYWRDEPPVLSTDGRHLAYACHRPDEDRAAQVDVLFDDRRFGPYANVWGIALSADGRHVAFAADNGAADRPWFYVVDGKRHGLTFDRAFPPRFSPDGRHVAWVAERHGRLVLFLDGEGYASSDDLVWAPTFDLRQGLSWAVLRGRRVSRVDIGPLS